jgi:hypothetical protein
MILVTVAQAPTRGENAADAGAERLKFMKDSVRGYQLSLGGNPGAELKLQETPVFRLGKQHTNTLEDGAIFLWTGDQGRPEVAIQVFRDARDPQVLWIHEFSSLSSLPLSANRNGRTWWSPTMPGLEFRPVPGAPKPADSVAQRARQMRALAGGFRATDDFGGKGWSELRLLPTAISRYGKSETRILDGALFAFVYGTDPEVFLFLEARPGKDSVEWQYALAPMTIFAVKGSYRGKAVWELPNRGPALDPSKPFFARNYEP